MSEVTTKIEFDYDFEGQRIGVVCTIFPVMRHYRKLGERTNRRAPIMCQKLDALLRSNDNRDMFRIGQQVFDEVGQTQSLWMKKFEDVPL